MKQLPIIFSLLIATISTVCFSSQYYVSPTGSDSNTGTIDAPYKTIPTAINNASAGDTIYVRGGNHTYSTTISISKSGTSTLKYNLWAYPDERPILDCSSMAVSSSNRGINLSGSYWYIKGIDIYKAGDNGMNISGSNNRIEFCSFYENYDSGLQLGSGASNNQVINCDSYYNSDPGQGNADGFSPKLDVGTGNYFYGCRSWQNSDDGWDGYMRGADNVSTVLENCWCFMNGYLKSGAASTGNGNGFKMGGGDKVGIVSNGDSLRHNMTLKNCLCFDNRVKGYDQNNNRGSMTLLNCTAYRNGTYNISVPGIIRVGSTLTVENCITLGSSGVTLAGVPNPVLATNSWPDNSTYPTSATTATSADFITIDTVGARGPRKADGSLPDITFMHLASGSQFIDAGTNVGESFFGAAPDVGAFESNYPLPVELISFVAVPKGSGVFLTWTTLTEVDNYGFELERRTVPGNDWKKIGFVAGSGTSNIQRFYSFEDKNILTGRYSYRLRQIDSDGMSKYTSEVEIVVYNKPMQLSLSDCFPNPFNPSTAIRFTVPEKSRVTLKIYNLLGQEVATLFDGLADAGEFQRIFQADHLSSGVYLSVLDCGGTQKVKKLVLMK